MSDSNYHNWLRKKLQIENFYKVPNYLKKICYEVEQDLIENEEVNLIKVSIVSFSKNYYCELYFDWVGYEKEMEIVAQTMNTTTNKIPSFMIAGEVEYMEKILEEYFPPFIPPFSGCKVHIVTNKHGLYSIE